jgi:hypothetical protein
MARDAWKVFEERYLTVKSDWDLRQDRYIENYRQLLAKDAPGPYNSRIATKYTASQVATFTAFATAGLLPAQPWVHGRCSEPFRTLPFDVEAWATEEFHRRLQSLLFYRIVNEWAQTAAMYGVGIVKMGWINGLGVVLRVTNPADMTWDPTGENLRLDATWVIEQDDRLSGRMLREEARRGTYNVDAVNRVTRSEGSDESEADRAERARTGVAVPREEGLDAPVRLHHMTERNRIVTVHVDSEEVLRDIENPFGYINYYDWAPYPEVFQVQGYSIPEQLEGIQREMNTARQQRTDVRSLTSNPMMRISRGSGLNVKGQRSRPGKIFAAEQGEIELLQFRDGGAPLLQEEMKLEHDGDRLVGVMGHTRGERGEQMKATVAQMLQGNVGTRFEVQQKAAVDYPFRPFLDDFVELAALYDEPIAITPQEWQVTRVAIERKACRIVLAPEAHVGAAMAKIQLYVQLMQGMQQIVDPVGLGEIAREALKLAQFPDPERVTRHIIPLQAQMAQGAGAATPATRADQGLGVARTAEAARARGPGQSPMSLVVPA